MMQKSPHNEINYWKNKDIDYHIWDETIGKSYNGYIYGYSWYLDNVSEKWDALILGEYDAIMPLPIKKKLGLKVIDNPLLAEQLGIFSPNLLKPRTIQSFIDILNKSFSIINLHFNKYINLDTEHFSNHIEYNAIYELDLVPGKNIIFGMYKKELRHKLDLALRKKPMIINGITPNEFINFLFKKERPLSNKEIPNEHLARVRILLSQIFRFGKGEAYAAYNHMNELCAVSLFVRSNNKVTIPIIACDQSAFENHIIELLIHSFIFKNTGINMTMSFENEEQSPFTNIYKEFGAETKRYTIYKKNKLPWPLSRW